MYTWFETIMQSLTFARKESVEIDIGSIVMWDTWS